MWTLAVLLLCAVAPARAGRITLDTEVSCRLTGPAGLDAEGDGDPAPGLCELRLANRGDEPATDLTIGLELHETLLAAERIARIAPGESWEGVLDFTPSRLDVGRNGLVVRVGYHDREGYPLAAISHAYLDRGPPRPDVLQARLSAVELSGEEQFAYLEVRNSGSHARTVNARLIVPRTLHSGTPPQNVRLGPGETVRLTFAIDNFAAFADSTYRIYALLESDLGGVVDTVFVPSNAKVTSGHAPTESLRIYLVGLAGLLAGAWLMAQFGSSSRFRSPSHSGPSRGRQESAESGS